VPVKRPDGVGQAKRSFRATTDHRTTLTLQHARLCSHVEPHHPVQVSTSGEQANLHPVQAPIVLSSAPPSGYQLGDFAQQLSPHPYSAIYMPASVMSNELSLGPISMKYWFFGWPW